MVSQYRREAGKEVTIRKRMIKKYGNRCMVCGYPGGFIEMHHIKGVADGGEHTEDNVILLCEKCHMEAHGWKKKKYIDPVRQYWKKE